MKPSSAIAMALMIVATGYMPGKLAEDCKRLATIETVRVVCESREQRN